MGIRKIALQEEGFESNFALSYFPETMTCDTSTESQTETSTSSVSIDTGDQGTEESAEVNIGDGFILPGGCRMAVELSYTPLQVGDVYASFLIESFIEEEDLGADDNPTPGFEPRFYRDPVNFKEAIIVHGFSNQGDGNIFITPRIVDFGHLWTTETGIKPIGIENTGDGELLIGQPYLGNDCDPEEFTLDLSLLDSDYRVPAGHSTIFEAIFTPQDLEDAICTVHITSDDADSPEIELKLKGNIGRDPSNQAPSVSIISPAPGYIHTIGEPLVVGPTCLM